MSSGNSILRNGRQDVVVDDDNNNNNNISSIRENQQLRHIVRRGGVGGGGGGGEQQQQPLDSSYTWDVEEESIRRQQEQEGRYQEEGGRGGGGGGFEHGRIRCHRRRNATEEERMLYRSSCRSKSNSSSTFVRVVSIFLMGIILILAVVVCMRGGRGVSTTWQMAGEQQQEEGRRAGRRELSSVLEMEDYEMRRYEESLLKRNGDERDGVLSRGSVPPPPHHRRYSNEASRNGARMPAGRNHPLSQRNSHHSMHRKEEEEEESNNIVQTAEGNNNAAQRLRRDLLKNYDRGSFPWEHLWGQQLQEHRSQNNTNNTFESIHRLGLPIELGINFHRVYSIDVKQSLADLIVWFRQRWTDPRLAWNPDDYEGLTHIWLWIGDGVGAGETSEIWTPDIELWNMESSMKESLSSEYATVAHTGAVFWSRPGHLRPACKFWGLDDFPFDTLKCTMEFGSWAYSGLYLRPVKMGEGFSVGGSATAGESFAEFRLQEEGGVKCHQHIYPPFPALPEEDWPVLWYDITFTRSWQPYVRGFVTTQVILNLLGIACFWLPVQCGERMGLAITSLLAAVASELVVADQLPSASEVTWFSAFSLFSLAFASFCVFECVAVIYFFYYTGDDLKPRWFKWFMGGGLTKLFKSIKDFVKRDHRKGCGGKFWKRDKELTDKNTLHGEEDTDESGKLSSDSGEPDGDGDVVAPLGRNSLPPRIKNTPPPPSDKPTNGSSSNLSSSSHGMSNRKLIWGADQEITFTRDTDDDSLRTFDLAPPQHPNLNPSSNLKNSSFSNEGGKSSSSLSSLPQSTNNKNNPRKFDRRQSLAQMHEKNFLTNRGMDADDFNNEHEATNNRAWKQYAMFIDEVCRMVIPVAYAIGLGVLLNQVKF